MLKQLFKGITYRAHHPKWSFNPQSGEGAKIHGGRFNRLGQPALYLSLDPTTAWMEAQQCFPFKPQPMILVAYEISCVDIVDLTDARTLAKLDASVLDLGCAWEDLANQKIDPPSWKLVDKLMALQASGILVPSFAFGCGDENKNLVLWNGSSSQSNVIKVIDDFGRLPKSGLSWD